MGPNASPLAFTNVCMLLAGIFLKHASRAIPGSCVQLNVIETLLKLEKDGVGEADTAAPESIIPERKGALSS